MEIKDKDEKPLEDSDSDDEGSEGESHTKSNKNGSDGQTVETSRKQPKKKGKKKDKQANSPSTQGDDKTKVKVKRARLVNSRRRRHKNRARRSGKAEEHRFCLDTGTDYEIIGKSGWLVLETLSGMTQIEGCLEGMKSSELLPTVSAVTAIIRPNQDPILLGVGAAALDERASQKESLVNSNYVGRFIDIDERSEARGGRQSMIVGGGNDPYHGGKSSPTVRSGPTTHGGRTQEVRDQLGRTTRRRCGRDAPRASGGITTRREIGTAARCIMD